MRQDGTRRSGYKNYFDYSLLFIIMFLLGFGLVMLYSTSSYTAQLKFNNDAYYLNKQIFSTAIGIFIMVVVSQLDYHILKKMAVFIYIASMASLFLVLTPIGVELNGARRWFYLGPISVQPAEIVKIGVIVFFALVLEKRTKSIRNTLTVWYIMGFALLPAALIYLVTDNLSSAIIVVGIAFVMVFIASPNYKGYILFVSLVAIAVLGFIYYVKTVGISSEGSFRMGRITTWLNPEESSQQTGFQVLQGLYAIGSGGLFGKGLGKSIQKLGFVPEAQNDMIYTIICEELGVIGGIAVILLFVFMIWRFMIIANNASDLYGSMLVVGIMAHIAIQVILNIAVVTNTIPNTGVTLPFISYGGTSIVFLLAEMGIALSVSKRIRLD